MKFNRNLMTGLIGLALIAAPITAAAKDNDSGGNNSHQARAESRSNESHASAPSHNAAPAAHNEARQERSARVETRAAAPEMNRNEQRSARVETRTAPEVNRNEQRARVETHNDARAFNHAPAVTEHRDVREDRHEANRDWRADRNDHDRDRNDHNRGWIYGDRGRDYDRSFDPDYDREYASGWVMPYSYGGGACAWARHLRAVYRHDEYTGHPAAAESLLYQMHRAERRCGGGAYGYNTYRYPY
jgi:hypothetical protein